MASGYIYFSDENTNIIMDERDIHYYQLKQPAYYNYKTIKIDISNPWVHGESEMQLTGARFISDLSVFWSEEGITGKSIFQVYDISTDSIITVKCTIYGFTDINNRKNDNLKIAFSVIE